MIFYCGCVWLYVSWRPSLAFAFLPSRTFSWRLSQRLRLNIAARVRQLFIYFYLRLTWRFKYHSQLCTKVKISQNRGVSRVIHYPDSEHLYLQEFWPLVVLWSSNFQGCPYFLNIESDTKSWWRFTLFRNATLFIKKWGTFTDALLSFLVKKNVHENKSHD